MKTIKIEDALKLENTIFIDVRTEKEYQDDHILNAYNMPLFNNDVRLVQFIKKRGNTKP